MILSGAKPGALASLLCCWPGQVIANPTTDMQEGPHVTHADLQLCNIKPYDEKVNIQQLYTHTPSTIEAEIHPYLDIKTSRVFFPLHRACRGVFLVVMGGDI